MNPRWTLYVDPKPRKGGLKNARRPISVKRFPPDREALSCILFSFSVCLNTALIWTCSCSGCMSRYWLISEHWAKLYKWSTLGINAFLYSVTHECICHLTVCCIYITETAVLLWNSVLSSSCWVPDDLLRVEWFWRDCDCIPANTDTWDFLSVSLMCFAGNDHLLVPIIKLSTVSVRAFYAAAPHICPMMTLPSHRYSSAVPPATEYISILGVGNQDCFFGLVGIFLMC